MGLSTSTHESKTYLNILGGKFTQKVKEGTEGAVSRINKKNETVWELHYDTLFGKIVDIKLEDTDYGKVWVITFQDGIDYFYLHLSYSSTITNGLMFRLPNIDFNQGVVLKVFRIFNKEKNKDQDFLVVYQGGTNKEHKVLPKFTKETPNGLPPMKKVKVKGVETWDNSDQLEFIQNMVETEIKPKLNGNAPAPEYAQTPRTRESIVADSKANEAGLEDGSDLPF